MEYLKVVKDFDYPSKYTRKMRGKLVTVHLSRGRCLGLFLFNLGPSNFNATFVFMGDGRMAGKVSMVYMRLHDCIMDIRTRF